jgi:hypothetical protein
MGDGNDVATGGAGDDNIDGQSGMTPSPVAPETTRSPVVTATTPSSAARESTA